MVNDFNLLTHLNAGFFCVAEFHVMTKKNEQAVGCTEDVLVLHHVKVAPPVFVLGAKYAVFRTALARLAVISQVMQKPDYSISSLMFSPLFQPLQMFTACFC